MTLGHNEMVFDDNLIRFPPVFEQDVVIDFPPLYDEITAAFKVSHRKDVVFSFGRRIYNPYRAVISPETIVHEAVHGERQGRGQQVLDWWKRYIEDMNFRLVEEVDAHRAEYRWWLENGNRVDRRRAAKRVALKLSDPLYGPMITTSMARKIMEASRHAGCQ